MLHILVLLKGWRAVCSQPAGPPEHWQVPSLADEWLSSKTPDNQQCVHRHRLAGFHLRSRQTFPTEGEQKQKKLKRDVTFPLFQGLIY